MPPHSPTGPPSTVLRIADHLERQGKSQEVAALRAVNAQYANMSLTDLVALTAQFTDKAAPPERVAGLDRLMAAFREASHDISQPPSVMSKLLQTAVQSGVTASRDMIEAAGGALEMFRVRPDAEIEYTRHAAERLTRYWGKEQARFAGEVESVLLEGLERGQSVSQIAARLRERADVSRSRARLIAANELGNASANTQQQSQTDAGITHYIWCTAHDERVRPEHKARDGKVFAWDDPPSDGHPGQAVRCRCVSVPVITPEMMRNNGDSPLVSEVPQPEAPQVVSGQPKGQPVADSIAITGKGKPHEAARRAYELIGQVHGDGKLTPIEFNVSRSTTSHGSFRCVGGKAVSIQLSTSLDHPLMTMAHETGHWLHNDVLGGLRNWADADQELQAIVDTARQSRAMTTMMENYRNGITFEAEGYAKQRVQPKLVAYYRQSQEIWARLYAQYIATRSGDATMLAELAKIRNSPGGRAYCDQWDDDDFAPLADMIDAYFVGKGWRT